MFVELPRSLHDFEDLLKPCLEDGCVVLAVLDEARRVCYFRCDLVLSRFQVSDGIGDHRAAEDAVRRRWGSLPTGPDGVRPWAETAARKQADADPRMVEVREAAEQAHRAGRQLAARQLREATALSQRAREGSTPGRVIAHAAKLRKQAERDRRNLMRIETLPLSEAAEVVRKLAARAEAEREAAERARAAREARAAQLDQFRLRSTSRHRTGPERDFGPSV